MSNLLEVALQKQQIYPQLEQYQLAWLHLFKWADLVGNVNVRLLQHFSQACGSGQLNHRLAAMSKIKRLADLDGK